MSSSSSRDKSTALFSEKSLVVDPFCFRQFAESESSKGYLGTVFDLSIREFEEIVNQRFHHQQEVGGCGATSTATILQDGYADFCKHFFVENDFTQARVNVLPITSENEGMLRSHYEARNDKELPVLTRYFPKELVAGRDGADNKLPVAKYLDLILYSREQINKENAAQGQPINPETAPWGIVSIKAQDVAYELPMTPITAMRNALGKEEGGSGVPLNREEYMKAVNYWKDHATVS